MAVEYCHRGGHYVDLDKNCEGKEINGEWVCWDHLTDAEQEEMESDDLTPAQENQMLEADREQNLLDQPPGQEKAINFALNKIFGKEE